MVLYHASQAKDLKEIKPKRTLSKNKYIGDFVFATPHKTLALMYLVPKGYATLMNYDKNPPSIILCAEKDEFAQRDKGGAIYELPTKNFSPSPQVELRADELASTKTEVPLRKEVYKSVLAAFEDNGISVEFIDQAGFDRLIKYPPSRAD